MLKVLCSAINALRAAWHEPAPTAAEEERYHDAKMKAESGIFDDGKTLCKSLSRYQRSGTGPIALALSEDPDTREVELALVARLTAAILKALRPEVKQ